MHYSYNLIVVTLVLSMITLEIYEAKPKQGGRPKPPPPIALRQVTTIEEYPSMMRIIHNSTEEHLCGATLITEKFLLTAGHCIMSFDWATSKTSLIDHKLYKIYGGTRFTNALDFGFSRKFIEWWKTHPKYTTDGPNAIPRFDIAIISVDDPFNILDFIAPYEIYSRDISVLVEKYEDMLGFNPTCRVGGWGFSNHMWEGDKRVFGKTTPGYVLRIMDVTLMNSTDCKTYTCNRDKELCKAQENVENEQCALTAVQTTDSLPFGDDGAALICGRYLWGIASWTTNNGCPHVFVHFSILAEMLDIHNINVTTELVANGTGQALVGSSPLVISVGFLQMLKTIHHQAS